MVASNPIQESSLLHLDRWLCDPLLEISWRWGTHFFCLSLHVRRIFPISSWNRLLVISMSNLNLNWSFFFLKLAPSFMFSVIINRTTDQLLRNQAPYIPLFPNWLPNTGYSVFLKQSLGSGAFLFPKVFIIFFFFWIIVIVNNLSLCL